MNTLNVFLMQIKPAMEDSYFNLPQPPSNMKVILKEKTFLLTDSFITLMNSTPLITHLDVGEGIARSICLIQSGICGDMSVVK